MPPRLGILAIAAILSGAMIRGQEPGQSSESYWGSVYSQRRSIFSARPTELLKYAIKDRSPGKALDIGMGQGRNSIFLVQQGWDVTGFDPSGEGIRQAQARAHKLTLHLKCVGCARGRF